MRAVLESVPPVTVPPRGGPAARPAGRRRPRRGVPAAGRRLRRDLRRQHRAAHPRQHPHPAADGRRAHLRRVACRWSRSAGSPASTPSRARPRSTRWACRPTAATSSTRWPPPRRPGSPDPSRMVRAYANPSAAMNLVRAVTSTGMGDLARVHEWNQEFVLTSRAGERYERVAGGDRPGDAVHVRLRGRRPHPAPGRDLRLATRRCCWTTSGRCCGWTPGTTSRGCTTCPAHFLWVGERTRQLDGAHIAFAAAAGQPDRAEDRPDAPRRSRPSSTSSGSTRATSPAG